MPLSGSGLTFVGVRYDSPGENEIAVPSLSTAWQRDADGHETDRINVVLPPTDGPDPQAPPFHVWVLPWAPTAPQNVGDSQEIE